jgi:hypothetical protein
MFDTTRRLGAQRIPWLWLLVTAGIIAVFAYSTALGIFLSVFWFIPMALADNIGRKKNRGGFWWGCLFGWLGVLIVACLGRIPTVEELELERQHRELQIQALQQQLPRVGS